MVFRILLAGTFASIALVATAGGVESGDAVVVVYNSHVPDSKKVAEHYAARRSVPSRQIIGLDLPTGETMSRDEYREALRDPLLKFLEKNKLLVYPPAKEGKEKDVTPTSAKVRYAVLCYGVPLRISEEPSLIEEGAEKIAEGLRRNGAAVDTELCTLPVKHRSWPLVGPEPNQLYAKPRELLNPTNGLLMVTRLDGPTAAIARGLVDKALVAETEGLWGRAYFDLRGLTNTDYKRGDDWIRSAAEITRRFGFETVVDERPETFSAAFPMSQIALYAGWYDTDASGPFTRPTVEFMPGAFAYHLHSFSAHTLRSATQNWCGPLLADGATATMGCIDEPFLDGTPKIDTFFACWLEEGATFGEAAYQSQRFISWQTTVIGDPLYKPFGKVPKAQVDALKERYSKLLEWADLWFANKGLVLGGTPAEMIQYLETPDVPKDSAVITEKIAELYHLEGKDTVSIEYLDRALKLNPSPQQQVRLTLSLADRLVAVGKEVDSLTLCEDFLRHHPEYPDSVGLYTRMETLANKLHETSKAGRYAQEIARLTGAKPETIHP